MNTTELSPAEAIEDYLASKHDVVDSTVDNHRYRLEHFLHWTEESGIGTMSELSGYDIEQYKNWRLGNESPECNIVTLKNHLHTYRQFLRWCESVDAVTEGLAEKVIIPSVGPDEQARDVAITHERACEIIDYLSRYEYASNAHICFHLSYHTGARRSGIHSLDVEDWHPEERYLAFRHRPEEGTRLKLGDDGERNVTISDGELARALDDYIANTRPDFEDEHGRRPLIASTHGRLHYQTITKLAYKVTRPCFYGADCPEGRDPDDCEATQYASYSKCPANVSHHPTRRSAITHHLIEDVPKEIVSERASVSTEVLDRHYDARTIEERRQNREQCLGDL